MLRLFILFFLIVPFAGFSQGFKGVVTDDAGIGLPGVVVQNSNSNHQAVTAEDGAFQLPARTGDSIRFRMQGYEEVQFVLTPDQLEIPFKLRLQVVAEELKNVTVVSKRLEKFDVGRLPVIKGVQITTGTNAVIELENLSGAKSSANPREMFAKIPGLNIWESDGAGIQMGIGGRGLSPNRTANFNTRQNGYDISADALGYPESYYTPPMEALKSIELIRGSAALQFGTQFGGLLNFNIKDAPTDTPFELTTRGTLGNYGYKGIFNRVTGTANRFFYQAYHQYKGGDGYRENSEFGQHQAFAQVGYYLKENLKLRLEYTHMNYLARQAGGLTDMRFAADPRKSFRDRNWFRVNWNMLAFNVDYEVSGKANLNLRSFGMLSSRESLGFLGKVSEADPMGDRDLIQGLFKNAGAEVRYLQRYSFLKNRKQTFRGAFVLGARYYRGYTRNNQGLASSGSDADFRFLQPDNLESSSYSFPSENASLFNENVLFLGKRFIANFGVRYEFITSEANGFYKRYNVHPLTKDTLAVYKLYDSNAVVRSLPLFGAGINFKLTDYSSIYLNCTQNYRAINFTDIRVANPNIVIDTLMKDEKGYTAEFGFRGLQKKYLTFDVALFMVYYGNKIGLCPKPGTTFKERTNIGDAINRGVEAFAEIDLIGMISDSSAHNLNLFVNAAYIDATYIRSREASFVGKKVEYVSPYTLKTGLKWKFRKMTFQYQLSYNSAQFSDATNSVIPSGDAVIGEIPAYTVMDFSGRYTFSQQFQLEIGINNLTNATYFTRRATAYPGPGILPSDGISGYFTLQYKFKAK